MEEDVWFGAQNCREVYVAAVDAMFQHEFAGRILPFDEAAAISYANLMAGWSGPSLACIPLRSPHATSRTLNSAVFLWSIPGPPKPAW